MTRQEVAAWTREMKRSDHSWRMDEVLYYNQGIHLFYKGGQKSGMFIQVMPDGSSTTGIYRDALPCITDADFDIKYSKKFKTKEEALKAIIERWGVGFLLTAVLNVD